MRIKWARLPFSALERPEIREYSSRYRLYGPQLLYMYGQIDSTGNPLVVSIIGVLHNDRGSITYMVNF